MRGVEQRLSLDFSEEMVHFLLNSLAPSPADTSDSQNYQGHRVKETKLNYTSKDPNKPKGTGMGSHPVFTQMWLRVTYFTGSERKLTTRLSQASAVSK